MTAPGACLLLALALLGGCRGDSSIAPGADADEFGSTAPSSITRENNLAAARALPADDGQDFKDAQRGLIGSDPDVIVTGAGDSRIWDTRDYRFLTGDAPDSVHASLWRQAKLNGIHGLFEVTEGVYQVRGYDISNMTLIRGRTGWIVVDPLTTKETATAAFALARRHLGNDPVSAILFTHSHGDHFGGIDAVLSEQEARDRGVPIIAPKGFLEEATSENVLAGVTMSRRAGFMFGMDLPRGPRAQVDSGLGRTVPHGQVGLLEPTSFVDHTPQPMDIDGVRFIFQYAPESEAPAELTFYLPDKKAFCGAEVVTHTMHNLYTLRGAKVRDPLLWSGYIDEQLQLFPDAEVVFASHHWPMWGHDRIVAYLEKQRDIYKYIHDQTLRLASLGYTPQEIAEQIELPTALQDFPERGYYGTVRHNAKAVYQLYFGWFDGNPANLDPLPPEPAAKKYVEAMGGSEETLRKGQAAFDAGDYRWAATLLNHLVFADPQDQAARALLAKTYDQLGYQSEAGPWRNFYLTGAAELRHGPAEDAGAVGRAIGLLRRVPIPRFFDSMAARINGPKAEGKHILLKVELTDLGEVHLLELKNSVLHHRRTQADTNADVTIRLTHDMMIRLIAGQASLREMVFSPDLNVDGSRLDLLSFLSLLDMPTAAFPIVTP